MQEFFFIKKKISCLIFILSFIWCGGSGSGVGQLGAVGIRPYHQGAGKTQEKKTWRVRGPVNLKWNLS